ncbi:MAG: twin-arginine translocase TatA/TatE family subunit [Alphaproteobacteria bacterium]
MFDVSGSEFLIFIIVALVILKPDDLPKVMYAFGKMMRKINRLGRDFYDFFDELAYEEEKKINVKKELSSNDLTYGTPSLIDSPEEQTYSLEEKNTDKNDDNKDFSLLDSEQNQEKN